MAWSKNNVLNARKSLGKISRSLGKTGEYLAMYDIALQGYECFEINGNMSFDLGLVNNGDVIKVQVKSTSKKRNKKSYQFRICRTTRKMKSSKKTVYKEKHYNTYDVDILALVFIPLKKVIYIPFSCVVDKKYFNLNGDEEFNLEQCLEIYRETKG